MENTEPSAVATDRIEELDRLRVFEGEWHTKGIVYATETTPEVAMIATDIYEWMPNKPVLVHQAKARIGNEAEVKTIELITYDPATQTYPMRYHDSLGNTGAYQANVGDNGVWIYLSKDERATVTPSKDGQTIQAEWEKSEDAVNWEPWMTVTLSRA